jgi:hypothetical protein
VLSASTVKNGQGRSKGIECTLLPSLLLLLLLLMCSSSALSRSACRVWFVTAPQKLKCGGSGGLVAGIANVKDEILQKRHVSKKCGLYLRRLLCSHTQLAWCAAAAMNRRRRTIADVRPARGFDSD